VVEKTLGAFAHRKAAGIGNAAPHPRTGAYDRHASVLEVNHCLESMACDQKDGSVVTRWLLDTRPLWPGKNIKDSVCKHSAAGNKSEAAARLTRI
jgi:hypothetical protein